MAHDLKAYREAKTILPHLNAILKVIDLSIRSLAHFKSYLPVMRILVAMEKEKTLLELNQKKYEAILKSKGKSNEET